LEHAKKIRANKAEAHKTERIERIAEIAKGNQELHCSKRYPIIYADPPWRYENPPMRGHNPFGALFHRGYLTHTWRQRLQKMVEESLPQEEGEVSLFARKANAPHDGGTLGSSACRATSQLRSSS
jgi:hypothetical protein